MAGWEFLLYLRGKPLLLVEIIAAAYSRQGPIVARQVQGRASALPVAEAPVMMRRILDRIPGPR